MTIYVSSTTGTQQDVDDAANYDPDRKAVRPANTKEEQPSADSDDSSESETAAEPDAAEEPESTEEEEEAEGPEEEEQPEEEEPPEVAKGPGQHKRLMRRLNELFEQRLTLREQNEALREENRRLKEGKGAEPEPPQQPAGLRRPDPSDAKYKGKPYEEFVEDLADFKVKERELQKAQADREAFVRGIFDEYNQQVEVARSKFEDFDEVVGKDVQVPVIAINAMYELDNGPEVAYYLGKHPEVREQLLDWNEPGTKGGYRRIVVELDRISRELAEPASPPRNGGTRAQSSSSPKPRSVTPTPAPIKPLGGSSATRSASVDPNNMDYQQYKRWFQKNYGGR